MNEWMNEWRLRQLVQYIRRYSTKCASFLAVSYLTFTNKSCQLWSYWTEFHEILTRFRGIISAVNTCIAIAISHSVSEWQSDKCGGVGNFAPFLPLNWLPWQRPLRNRKIWNGSRKFTQIPSIWWKDRENRSSRYWDSFAYSKKEEINASKIYSLVGNLSEWAKLMEIQIFCLRTA